MQVFKVDQWMNRDVKKLTKDRPCVEAAELMRQHNIGCVIIVEHEEPIGIVSERDIIRKIVAARNNPENTSVETIMSHKVLTVDVDSDIKEVSNLMVQHNIKKVPVVENDKIKGILTTTDIVRIMAQFNKLYDAKDIIELGVT